MKFNYQSELKKFVKNAEETRRMCAEAGMSEEKISELIDYDWQVFKKERSFCKHCQQLPAEVVNDEEDESSLISKYIEGFSCEDSYFDSFEVWIEMIEDKRFYRAVKSLSVEQQILIWAVYVEGYKQVEVAEAMGVGESAISNKMTRIKKNIKSFIRP